MIFNLRPAQLPHSPPARVITTESTLDEDQMNSHRGLLYIFSHRLQYLHTREMLMKITNQNMMYAHCVTMCTSWAYQHNIVRVAAVVDERLSRRQECV